MSEEIYKRQLQHGINLSRYMHDNYISKDKIKDKIKDLKNNLKSKEEQNEYFETLAKIEILEELLRW